MKHLFHFVLLLSFGLLAGCKTNSTSSTPTTFDGSPVTIGTGSANSWIKTDASGKVTSVGVTISDAALASIGTRDSMFELPAPSGVSSIFKSIALDYATHDPAPYNKPHIDPHFFLIVMAARMGNMSGMDGMMPMNMMMPSGYTTDSMSEMMMGVHWMDTTASEYHGTPFQCAFDYGFSMGNLVFYETMCDKASLDGHKVISNTIRQPMMMNGMTMSMPSSYAVTYDANAKVTNIELDGFAQMNFSSLNSFFELYE